MSQILPVSLFFKSLFLSVFYSVLLLGGPHASCASTTVVVIERSESARCADLLQNTNVSNYLKRAKKQCVGNCMYHAKQRANEYVIYLKTGQRVNLNTAFVTVNRTRTDAYFVLRNALRSDSVIDELIAAVSVDGYHGDYNKEGDLPAKVGIQESDLKTFERDLRVFLAKNVVKLKRHAMPSDFGLAMFEGNVSANYWKKYQEALAATDKFFEERGAGLNQKFRYRGVDYTPQSFRKSLGLDDFYWRPYLVGDDVTGGIPVKDLAGFIRAQKYPIRVVFNTMGKLSIDAGLKELYPKRKKKTDVQSDPEDGHGTLIVGVSNDGESLIIQNSWGSTVFGPEGLIPIPLSLAVKYIDKLRIVVEGTKPLNLE